ncbi:hypothetical protein [Rhizobium sp. P007]|uniref:hypothetical protein n=1 Tax=Rhizobium phage RR1-A TaxID=929833 RepID=UPI00034275A7|nr:hypothetical protein [Rhizobium sp. P007]YP_008130189.1 hypothetical protein RHXG_00042 [Rhizobium phage RR1-A]AGN34418.1 hypothetical protein RHXG_00042 [Rhizobium phage RR1-A]CAD7058624.1 hypothetical protein RP007_02628 [Rhizobium sp. P007]
MTSEKTWYPTFMIDEDLPEGKSSPEAWLPFLTQEEAGQPAMFNAGDILAFEFVERRGNIEITINPDGSHGNAPRCADTADMFGEDAARTTPVEKNTERECNSFWDYESETFAETLDEFAKIYAECANEVEPISVVISTAYWSPTFRFRIADDCKSLIQQPATDAESAEE